MTRSRPVLPYRVLPDEAVLPHGAGWLVIVDSTSQGVLVDGSPFPEWDAQLEFTLQRDFEITVPLADALEVRPRPNLFELSVSATSGGGLYREVVARESVPENDPSFVRVTVRPASNRLAKDLELTTGLYLGREAEARDGLAPVTVGSRLWEMAERFRLEGGAARLPIYEVPFSKVFPGEAMGNAEFHIELADEFESEIEAGLAVYLNSERSEMISELKKGGAAEIRLWAGIIRRALVAAACSRDLSDASGHPAGTLGATLTKWAGQIWPHMPLSQVRGLVNSDFSKVEAQIESWVARTSTGAVRGQK